MKLTEPQRRALQILASEEGIWLTCREVARRMWPNSGGWTTLSGVRNGVVRGKAMPGLAGRLLWRLHRMSLVWPHRSHDGWIAGWRITQTGLEVLSELAY